MSRNLPAIDLSAAIVGTSGAIPLGQMAVPSGLRAIAQTGRASLVLYNESGCGLQLTSPQTGATTTLPAGGWDELLLDPDEQSIQYRVLYVLPSAPVSYLLPVYYSPGEPVKRARLGNSPIGISGSVSTSTVAVTNDGNAAGTSIVEATVVGRVGSAVSLTNDAALSLKPLSNGVQTEVLAIVPGTASTPATVTLHGTADSANVLNNPAGGNLPSGQLGDTANGNIMAQAGGETYFKRPVHIQDGAGLDTIYTGANGIGFAKGGGTLLGCSAFGGTGSGTFSHGLLRAPSQVQVTCYQADFTSQTQGTSSYGSSTCFVTSGAGYGWKGLATWN